MKGAIVAADQVTTVSRTYAREIRTNARGHGLDGVLRDREGRFTGIENGIDHQDWDPGNDPHIPRNYSPATVRQGKAACRKALAAELGLGAVPGDRAVMGLVVRLVDLKGIDLLNQAMEGLMSRKLVLALLGSGTEIYESMCRGWSERWPHRVACRRLARRIYAGSDFFLMPSREEPCGLSQLFSMRYGTVPIVHATGGLADTVIDCSRQPREGTGYVFEHYSVAPLYDAVDRALAMYGTPRVWTQLRRRLMQVDHSWDRSAAEYESMYQALM
jgi:starch synthase